MPAEKPQRRTIAFILSGIVCLFCVWMGLRAYFSPSPSEEFGNSVQTSFVPTEPFVDKPATLIQTEQVAAVLKEDPYDVPIPEIPNPKQPTPPIDPVPKPKPNSESSPIPVREKAPTRTHIVAKGDTLSSISLKYYGTSNRWQEIYEINKAAIPNKNNIKIGTPLTIP